MSTVISAAQKATSDIDAYIRNHGGVYSEWYVGIAADPRDRLFSAHKVSEQGDPWIYRDCGTDAAARAVEQSFFRKGCKGGDGGGDRDTRFVYAYKISPTTIE